MGSKTLFFQFNAPNTLDQVQEAANKAFIPLGGQITKLGNGLRIVQGKEGVQFAFTADFDATLTINQTKDDQFDMICAVNWKMNSLSIACLIIGIFVFGILWVIPALSLFIDPSSRYNQAMYSVPSFLKMANL